jgi:ankyrin repeat protein
MKITAPGVRLENLMIEITAGPEGVALEADPGTDTLLRNVTLRGPAVGVATENVQSTENTSDNDRVVISFLPPPPLTSPVGHQPPNVDESHHQQPSTESDLMRRRVNSLLGRAEAAEDRDDWKTAAEAYEDVLTLSPGRADVQRLLERARKKATSAQISKYRIISVGAGQVFHSVCARLNNVGRWLSSLKLSHFQTGLKRPMLIGSIVLLIVLVAFGIRYGIDVATEKVDALAKAPIDGLGAPSTSEKTPRDPSKDAPFIEAARNGDLLTVKQLFFEGASVMAKDSQSRTALVWASWHAHVEVVKFLLEKGASVHVVSTESWTPLFYAVIGRHQETVRLLLDRGAIPNARDPNGDTPLTLAQKKGFTEIVALLKAHGAMYPWGASQGKQDGSKDTSLIEAAKAGNLALVQQLLADGASIEARDSIGYTPLLWASFHGHHAVVYYLLVKGAGVDVTQNDRWTALHCAALNGYTQIARLLLAKGASANVRTKTGLTPLQLAEQRGHAALASLLKTRGATH